MTEFFGVGQGPRFFILGQAHQFHINFLRGQCEIINELWPFHFASLPPPQKKKCLLTKYSALRLFSSVITITHWLFSTRPRRSKASMILLFCCIWSFTIFITFLFALTTRNYLQIKVGMNGIKSSESSIWEPASFSKLRRKDIWESKWGFSASFILLTHST